jgi:uncharacterized protein YndB with AHSA1/START domain
MIDGDEVLHELSLPAPPDEVFDMFVDPALLVRWIGISAELEPRPDGVFRFEVVPGEFCEGRYVVVDRPRRLVFTWGWTAPSFALPPGSSEVEVTFAPGADGSSTELRLVHRGLSSDGRVMHDDGWTNFLGRLSAVVAGDPPPDYPTADPDERLEQLRNATDREGGADGR